MMTQNLNMICRQNKMPGPSGRLGFWSNMPETERLRDERILSPWSLLQFEYAPPFFPFYLSTVTVTHKIQSTTYMRIGLIVLIFIALLVIIVSTLLTQFLRPRRFQTTKYDD
uniref:Uncharacterized protein n=2 Tax=Caenorhabditis japonica TaxID=281687 RepID=A0A8R1IEY9_CAEJA